MTVTATTSNATVSAWRAYIIQPAPVRAPEPPPLSHHEQLQCIKKAVSLGWHRLHGLDDGSGDRTYANERKRSRMGWRGLNVYDFSDREWAAIRAFVNARRDRVWKSIRRYIDESLWFLGSCTDNPEVSVWFRDEADRIAFEEMLGRFKRPIVFVVTGDITDRCWKLIRKLNYRLVTASEGSVLSLEDDPDGHAIMIRLSL